MYAALHVVNYNDGATSPTLDIDIERDDNAGFSSASTEASFTQATGITSEWVTSAVASADDYWRVTWTIGGTGSPSFDFWVGIGFRS